MSTKRILVVEDDLAVQEGITDILEVAGYEVLKANNGQEALTVLQRQRPDLIISDIMMPYMDGYDFYEAVHGRAEWVTIPFIFLTAKGEKEDVRLGKQLGADDYLVKPFEREDLLIAIEAKLKRLEEVQRPILERVAQLEEQLTRSERLALLGELAAEFAHHASRPATTPVGRRGPGNRRGHGPHHQARQAHRGDGPESAGVLAPGTSVQKGDRHP